MAMQRRDELIDKIRKTDLLLEHAVMHGDEHEACAQGGEMSSRPSIWEKCKTRITSPLFRDSRERLKAVARLPKVVEAVARLGGFGTFDVRTGEPITSAKRSSGYQVSFCPTTTEDSAHANCLTDSAFDATVAEMARQTGSMPEVGVYKGGHEISLSLV